VGEKIAMLNYLDSNEKEAVKIFAHFQTLKVWPDWKRSILLGYEIRLYPDSQEAVTRQSCEFFASILKQIKANTFQRLGKG
jgi:hypothetical protein